MNKQIAKEIFESDDFWNSVKVKEEFKNAIKEILDTFTYPLYFLDFEIEVFFQEVTSNTCSDANVLLLNNLS